MDFSSMDVGKMQYDNETRSLDVFMSGNQNMTTFTVTPVACRTDCPDPTKDCAQDSIIRKWSDV